MNNKVNKLDQADWPQWLKDANTENAVIEQDELGHVVWISGTWRNGAWKGGLWLDGTWEYGTWECGTWECGTWEDGTWLNGAWEGWNCGQQKRI